MIARPLWFVECQNQMYMHKYLVLDKNEPLLWHEFNEKPTYFEGSSCHDANTRLAGIFFTFYLHNLDLI